MSDISIPGVTASKYKTDELIQGLMKVERIPRDRAERDLEAYREQQNAWRLVNRHSTALRDAAKTLYSFENPFSEKLAESTAERAVTATAKREAREESFKVDVRQIAEADSFLSADLGKDATIPKGKYTFRVGDKSLSFSWKGGSAREFVDALNRRSQGLVRGALINVGDGKNSLLVESMKTGAANRLSFEDDALPFALERELIRKTKKDALSVSAADLQAKPGAEAVSTFSRAAAQSAGYILEYTASMTEVEVPTTAAPTGPEIGDPGSLTYAGITVTNESSELALPPLDPVETAPPAVDPNVLSLKTPKGARIPLPPLADGKSETFSIRLGDLGDASALVITNKNAARAVSVTGIRIVDPRASGEYEPVNPVSVAQDAVIKYEGITVTRPTNAIEDLVPGVTLNLSEPTEKPATITVKPDVERAKEAIIEFVAKYNRVVAEINILTQNKPEVISEIQYFTPEERTDAEKRLGMMQGDTTLNGVKSNLQRITASPWATTDENSFRLLADLGISTRAQAGAGIEASRLRGYLEIDEKRLDEALKTRMPSVKALFGFDTDGDLVIDTGVAHAIDAQLTPYIQTGGIFASRTNGLGTKIDTTQKKIAQLDEQLRRKEAELKAKYGQMEGTLNSLEGQSRSIQNFSNQNNGSR
ncbi:MAG TPA: flagellar filament capping protein FliD [Treponemataceae bacterium]|nr:flagellar filament capping protein FliD [Treponemataceae bacterium]